MSDRQLMHENGIEEKLTDCLIISEKYFRIGQFAGGLAHNLQSPLTAIKGYAQLIQADHAEIEELELILQEVKHIQNITHNLMIRMRAIDDPAARPVLLNDLIRTELEFLNAHMLFKHKVRTAVNLDPELPVIRGVYADFSQITLNLLLNAIDAVSENKSWNISITTRHDDHSVYLEIRDSGNGILQQNPGEQPPLCFTTKKSFSEIHDEKEPVGLGIGLMIVQKLTVRNMGTFSIQSDESGTLAVVAIPINSVV